MLIPPSVGIVLYGLIANQSSGELSIAGIVPGILVALTIACTVLLLVLTMGKGERPESRGYSWREKLDSLKVVGPMVVLFAMVTGVICIGIATPTEADSLGAFGALLLTWRGGRLSWTSAWGAICRAANTSSMTCWSSWARASSAISSPSRGITQDLVAWIGSLDVSRWTVLVLILGLFIVLGCCLDQISVLILAVPVTLPIVISLGFPDLVRESLSS